MSHLYVALIATRSRGLKVGRILWVQEVVDAAVGSECASVSPGLFTVQKSLQMEAFLSWMGQLQDLMKSWFTLC